MPFIVRVGAIDVAIDSTLTLPMRRAEGMVDGTTGRDVRTLRGYRLGWLSMYLVRIIFLVEVPN